MNGVFSFNAKQIENIKNGTKMFLFGNNISDKINIGDSIYISDKKSIIGECRVKDVCILKKSNLGCYYFLYHFAKYIEKDEDLVKRIEFIYNFNLPNYNQSYKTNFIYSLDELVYFEKTGKRFDVLKMTLRDFQIYEENRKKAEKVLEKCDEWLENIGYYNKEGISYCAKCLEIENFLYYNISKDISCLRNIKYKEFERAPKNWALVTNKI